MFKQTKKNKTGRSIIGRTVSRILTVFFVLSFFFTIGSGEAKAAVAAYSAQEMIRSGQVIEMVPGEVRDFMISFKNIGSLAWADGGSNFVSVYTYGPKYRTSIFADSSWLGATQPAKIFGVTAPGQLGMFRFKLHAPSTVGDYTETFALAAESLTWIAGGEFSVQIKIRPAAVVVVPKTNTTSTVTSISESRGAYSANEISRSASTINLTPGARVLFSIDFKNIGQATWLPDGRRFVSVYTYGPKYRKSVFQDSSWESYDRPTRIFTQSTAPGKTGTIRFYLKAPTTPGIYNETFAVAAEDLVWIPGGLFTINIVVSGSTANTPFMSSGNTASLTSIADTNIDASPIVNTQSATGYAAAKMLTSSDDLVMMANTTQEFRIAFKNTGILPWVRYGSEPLQLNAVTASAQSFRDPTWNGDCAAILGQDRTDPGQLAFFTVRLRAPGSSGSYLAHFELQAGGLSIDGGTIEIPIIVSGGSVSTNSSYITSNEFAGVGSNGPNIRVGLFTTTAPVVIAASGTYQLIDGGTNQPIKQLSGVTTVAFNFSKLEYTVTNGSYVYVSDYHVHLRPDDPETTTFEVVSYENRPTWDTSLNFNRFRGDLAVHHMRSTGNLWVIEELPLEKYLRGLAETSNGSPIEYQRALVTAARTYALYVISIGGKHKSEYHDINPSAGDQVYKGYTSELVRPNVVAAVEATRGLVVTYNDELVVTPYFSRSDGRTRAWSEVWGGGNKPWLVSVAAPYDQGRTLWGHGVGLSASDAVGRAADGMNWVEILRYYYTGTEIKRLY